MIACDLYRSPLICQCLVSLFYFLRPHSCFFFLTLCHCFFIRRSHSHLFVGQNDSPLANTHRVSKWAVVGSLWQFGRYVSFEEQQAAAANLQTKKNQNNGRRIEEESCTNGERQPAKTYQNLGTPSSGGNQSIVNN